MVGVPSLRAVCVSEEMNQFRMCCSIAGKWLLDAQQVRIKVISGFQAHRQAGRQWRGSDPLKKHPCRSQVGFTIHCATNAPQHGGVEI
ncbi:hypothetical protein PoB_000063100 [Plakobranchus ocellatus]|uniref:Uncharacterized protein n=1 Tax=Plakobranchus ocellatus TaxID=259542 RepID=A0AAV3XVQ3_9GAST|nr:hypothetical protein PoB_000063100 [Plakobranchus ocellatus]